VPQRHPDRRAPLLVLHLAGDTGGELSETQPAEVRSARFSELSAATLHGILGVRQDVFVVEQNCAYRDIDARDREPATLHLWIEDGDGAVVSTLRVLDEGDGTHRIGRVATAASSRDRGCASALMRRALELSSPPIVLSAQAYLVDWYAGFGFEECGERWIEDGIEHAPMRLGVRR
jgi:ElaA protein